MTWKPPETLPDLSKAKIIAIDVETFDPDIKTRGPGALRDGYLVGFSVATEFGKWYFPIEHADGKNMDKEKVRTWAKTELCRPNQPKIGANIMYDLEYMWAWGVEVAGPYMDIQTAEALLYEDHKSYSLENISQRRLGIGKTEDGLEQYAVSHGFGGEYKGQIYRMPADVVGPYCEDDSELCLKLWAKVRPELAANDMDNLFRLECRQLPMLLAMRRHGVKIDVELAEIQRQTLKAREAMLTKQIKAETGFYVSVNSGEELAKACDKLNIKYKTLPSGFPNFTNETMRGHPFLEMAMELREVEKLRSSFVESAILDNLVGDRIYGQFHPVRGGDSLLFGTAIGRYSSSKPNLQQIPARSALGKKIRELFIPESEDHDWVKADYSQIEPRIALHYGKGPEAEAMRDAYNMDPSLDCYNMMMESCPGVTRDQIKIAFLGSMYGMGKDKFAKTIKMPTAEANAIRQAFFEGAPYLVGLAEDTSSVAAARGWIRTYMNRRRHFDRWEKAEWGAMSTALPEAEAREKWGDNIRRAYTYRSIQTVVSGTAADCYKTFCAELWESGLCEILGPPLTLVHDESDFSVPQGKQGDGAVVEMKEIMENCVKLSVPLLADIERGPSWGEVA